MWAATLEQHLIVAWISEAEEVEAKVSSLSSEVREVEVKVSLLSLVFWARPTAHRGALRVSPSSLLPRRSWTYLWVVARRRHVGIRFLSAMPWTCERNGSKAANWTCDKV